MEGIFSSLPCLLLNISHHIYHVLILLGLDCILLDPEKSVLLLPFGLFTTQIPYVILGVMYLLYIGMAFLNRPELSENPNFKAQEELAGKIEFVERTSASDLPVIDISNQNVSNQSFNNLRQINGESDFETTVPEFPFCQYSRRIARCETLTSIFQSRNTSFSLFSRPPPVTA